jgi:UMF1 family MFS transporter
MKNIHNDIKNIEDSHSSKELKKKRISWYLYDFANSAYSTTVITLFLGPYLTTLAKASSINGIVTFFGLEIPAGSIFPYSISISVLLQAFLLPFVGAIADKFKKKNFLLGFIALIGSIATVSFFFLNENIFLIGSLLLIISNLAFGASIVVYNSFLNQISTESEREEVSSKGWAIGYLGGGILLIINLIIFLNNDLFGISKDLSIRINLALAGFWWALFSIPSIINLREKADKNIKGFSLKLITGTFSQLKSTFIDAKNYPIALLFLIAYLFYNDGIQSVISLSSQFGQEELKLNLSFLTIVILIVQFVAALGALLFMKLAKKIGEKNSILFGIFIWIIILVYCYALLVGAVDFLIVAIFIALVMGGTQSISRSLYSKLIPKNKEAEYFSFYEISEKGSSWIGPLVFGLVYQFTLSYRFAILSLVIFFIIGGGILLFTKVNLKEFQKKLQTEE